MTKLVYRKVQIFLVLMTAFVLFFSLYSQYVIGLQPCPLCLMQRLCVFLLMGLMCLSFGLVKKAHIISLFQVVFACAGLFFSLRHLWLQLLPEGSAPVCMPGLDILIHYFPWQSVARALLWGAGDCAEKTWSMLGISMPGWSALYFLFMAASGVILFMSTRAFNLNSASES